MALKITKKAGPAAPEPKIEPVPAGTRPKLKKPIKVGEFSILPDIDIKEQPGKAFFLIHLFKPYWFKFVSLDPNGVIKMCSPAGTVFDSNLSNSVQRNYMVCLGPEELTEPSIEVTNAVRSLVVQP